MADQEEWSTNANEALQISMLMPGPDSTYALSTFSPRFTYPIFGEEERIFGYQGLRIHLRFTSYDVQPNVEVTYDRKFKTVGDTKALDIEKTLRDWLPSDAFDEPDSYNRRIIDFETQQSWKPPGELLHSYNVNARNFEIYCGELTDPAVQKLIERMQIFISLFIEGGTPLDLSDQEWTLARWRVFFVYEKLRPISFPTTGNISSNYSLAGYSTSYRFITYQPHTPPSSPKSNHHNHQPPLQTFTLPPSTPLHPTSLPARSRISQFLILPPFQNSTHGTHLLKTMTITFLSDPHTTEITVEDPSEAFDDLRDYVDFARLSTNGTFSQIRLRLSSLPTQQQKKRTHALVPTSRLLDLPLLASLRSQNKLAPRQFARLVELHLLRQIPPHSRQGGPARLTQRGRATDEGDRMYYYWRLLVKQRVYKKSKDLLMQLDRAERVQKVEDTLGDVVGDYERLLRGVEKRKGMEEEEEEGHDWVSMMVGGKGKGKGEGVSASGGKRERGKRKTVVGDEEDDDEDDDGDEEREGKRARIEGD